MATAAHSKGGSMNILCRLNLHEWSALYAKEDGFTYRQCCRRDCLILKRAGAEDRDVRAFIADGLLNVDGSKTDKCRKLLRGQK